MTQPFVGEKARKMLDIIERWVDEECIPADAVYSAQMGIGDERYSIPFSCHVLNMTLYIH